MFEGGQHGKKKVFQKRDVFFFLPNETYSMLLVINKVEF